MTYKSNWQYPLLLGILKLLIIRYFIQFQERRANVTVLAIRLRTGSGEVFTRNSCKLFAGQEKQESLKNLYSFDNYYKSGIKFFVIGCKIYNRGNILVSTNYI